MDGGGGGGAALARSRSGTTFASLGVPPNICDVFAQTRSTGAPHGKVTPKLAQRKIIEQIYGATRNPRFRLLIDSAKSRTRDTAQQGGYEDAAALALICPYLDQTGRATEDAAPGASVCVTSPRAERPSWSMRSASQQ